MNKIIYILVIFLISCFTMVSYAQNQNLKSEIVTYARYKDTKGMELRIFPDKKYTLNLGVKKGFIIERAEGNNEFKELVTIVAYNSSQWENLINSESNKERKNQIEMVHFFFESLGDASPNKIDFSNGISDLRNQKSNEDLTYMIFVLSALKDAKIAEALGLSFIDKTAIKGKTYHYRSKLIDITNNYNIESPKFTIKAVDKKFDYKNYFYVKKGDGNLGFYWKDIPTMHGYDIERANFGKSNFVKLNNAPIYSLTNAETVKSIPYGYLDKNLINYKKYTYRFYAHSVFGERIKLFEMTTFPVDLTPPPTPKMFKPIHKNSNEVLISWEMSDFPKDFKGFAVARASKNKGNFVLLHNKLLPKKTNQFIDKTFNKDAMNYYVVQAIDTANNISSTTPFAVVLIDSSPPKKPMINSVKVDSLGVAYISVKLNKEKDLMGYRIFRSNSKKHEFSAIQESFIDLDSTSIKVKTIFKDTISLNSLTKNIYYRVKALDFNYNQSDFSDIYTVARPDTIPPSTPVFKKIKAYEDKIHLEFSLSESRDVKSHFIYRKTALKDKWELLSTINNNEQNFNDNNVQKGVTYYYSLRAIDISNLYSEYATTIYSTPIEKGVLPIISNFKLISKDNKAIMSWSFDEKDLDIYYIIYRKTPKSKLKQYKKTENLFFEDQLKNKGNYSYGVKAFSKKGGQSAISKILDIVK